jgi:hypothetical protein
MERDRRLRERIEQFEKRAVISNVETPVFFATESSGWGG